MTAELIDKLKCDVAVVWKRILDHPFVVEATRGDLPREKFVQYVLQDYNYLVDSVRVFCLLSAQAPTVEIMRLLMETARSAVTVELLAYERLIAKLGFDLQFAQQLKPLAVNIRYREFLLEMSRSRPFPEAMAAVLPCYQTYADIALVHAQQIAVNPDDMYRSWAQSYLMPEYLTLVRNLESILMDVGIHYAYDKLRNCFARSVQFELDYWEAVYTASVTYGRDE